MRTSRGVRRLAMAAAVFLGGTATVAAQCVDVPLISNMGKTFYDVTFRGVSQVDVATTGAFNEGSTSSQEWRLGDRPVIRIDNPNATETEVVLSAGGNSFPYVLPPGPGMFAVVWPFDLGTGDSVTFVIVSVDGTVLNDSEGTWDYDDADELTQIAGEVIPTAFDTSCGPITGGEEFGLIARMAQDLAADEIGTFHEREDAIISQSGQFYLWSRLFGSTGLGNDTGDVSQGGGQVGVGYIIPGQMFETRLSAFGSFAGASADFDILSANVRHNGAGLIATFLKGNAYVDLVGKWSDVNIDTSSGFDSAETGGSIWTGSVEAGYAFDLTPQTIIEPQAQLIYSNLNLDDIALQIDDSTWRVGELTSGDSFRGRLGLRLAHDFGQQGSVSWTVWGRADLWQEFAGSNAFDVTDSLIGDPMVSATGNFEGGAPTQWIDLTGGLGVETVDGIFFNGSVRTRFIDGDTTVGGSASVKVKF